MMETLAVNWRKNPRVRERLLTALLIVVAAIYLIQLLSPLRINTDSMIFLRLASSLSDGKGCTLAGDPTHFPSGYPRMIAWLGRMDLASSAAMIALNLGWLLIGVASTYGVYRAAFRMRNSTALGFCIVTLLSATLIKHVTLPQSDVAFVGAAMGVCWLLCRLERQEGSVGILLFSLLALAGMAVAISIRTVGIALFPAFLWALLGNRRERIGLFLVSTPRGRWLLAALAVVLLLAAILVVCTTRYGQEAIEAYRGGGGVRVVVFRTLDQRLMESGLLMSNDATSKMGWHLSLAMAVLGASAHVLLLIGIWRSPARWSSMSIYGVAYVGLLLLWPYFDPRFYLPLVPLAVVWVPTAWKSIHRQSWPLVWLGRMLAFVYLTLGVVALAYTTWLSLSGSAFYDRYAGGRYRDAFAVAQGRLQELPNRQDGYAVELLDRYEWRCRAGRSRPGGQR